MLSTVRATDSTDTPMSAARERSTSMKISGLFSCRSLSGCTMPGFFCISPISDCAASAMFS